MKKACILNGFSITLTLLDTCTLYQEMRPESAKPMDTVILNMQVMCLTVIHYVDYQLEVNKGKLTAIANF